MAKGRSKQKANAIKLTSQTRCGMIHKKDGGIVTVYQQGYESYFNGMLLSDAQKKGGSFLLGWTNALNSDKLLHSQCSKPHVRQSIENRMLVAYELEAA